MADKHHRSRSRSRSPYRDVHPDKHHHHRHRSRYSPHHHHKRTRSPAPTSPRSRPLPYNARSLSLHDLTTYTPLFALYLDIQKDIILENLEDKEIRGRWKSFVGKWNRGELAEGWYDPKTLEKANVSAQSDPEAQTRVNRPDTTSSGRKLHPREDYDGADNPASDDEYGPFLPTSASIASYNDQGGAQDHSNTLSRAPGPMTPSLTDLRDRDEHSLEEAASAKKRYIEGIREDRRIDRKQQKERLDELVPRAEAGTRERQLEKKREKADSIRAFAAGKEAAGKVELRDADVMGDEDSLGELKRMKMENQRKKNERELRKEEILRARRAEMEARLQAAKEREEKTMSLFREIARQRFGGGGDNRDE
ncbi:hypothetical protein A1O7_07947 [Cladophialophora yegresii CBS 114405]|uniref:Uncharacterized protein n=1 Tax=Cladophialophora yegresii CBS 114405 TaxID=1182544 RepID=W9WGF5_9EURO|nr:uncharacterized protein A1O7_07947 [Cladophialophora yegresii CBS 114405]EXJ57599.1 hypothetical protein A1O7_07947 [Cladophialophora yegresii CBS 114405]